MCQGRKLPEAIRRAILRMFRAGASYRTIAVTLGVSLPTVWRTIKANPS